MRAAIASGRPATTSDIWARARLGLRNSISSRRRGMRQRSPKSGHIDLDHRCDYNVGGRGVVSHAGASRLSRLGQLGLQHHSVTGANHARGDNSRVETTHGPAGRCNVPGFHAGIIDLALNAATVDIQLRAWLADTGELY